MSRSSNPPSRPRRRWIALLGGFVVVLAVLAGATWIFRMPLAEFAVARWCDGRQLDCRLEITRLDLSRVEVEALRVGASGGTPFAARQVAADLAWAGFAAPRLTGLAADAPIIRARFDGERFDLYGLERLVPQGGGAGDEAAALPAITVSDGRLELETPAGTLSGTLALDMSADGNADAQIDLSPAELADNGNSVSLAGGTLSVSRRGEQLNGVIALDLTSAELNTFRAGATRLAATLRPTGTSGPVHGEIEVSSQALRYGAYGVGELAAAGALSLDIADISSLEGLPAALRSATLQLSAQAVEAGENGAQDITVDLDLGAVDDALSGPIAVQATRARASGWGRVEAARAVGDVTLRPAGALSYRGGLTVDAASLAPERRADWAGRLPFPTLLEVHEAALADALDRALADVSFGLDLDAGFTPASEDQASNWQISVRRATQFRAASGATVSISPFSEGPWLQVGSETGSMLRGQIATSGGGLPSAQVQVDEAAIGDGRQSVTLGTTQLSNWRAGELALAANLDRLVWQSGDEAARATARGQVGIDGPFAGLRFETLSLFGGVDARRDAAGWRAQTSGNACLGLTMQAAELAGVRFGETAASLCPPQGRLLRPLAGGGLGGALAFGTLDMPVIIGGRDGQLTLEATELDWRSHNGLELDIDGQELGLILTLDNGDLDLAARAPAVSIAVPPGARPRFDGVLREATLGGDVIPADVLIDAARFDLTAAATGLSGAAQLGSVIISDRREDPLYLPLIGDFDAILRDGALSLTGPLRLAASQRAVADVDLALTIPALNGSARIVSNRLVFDPAGLQPRQLSDRLRGIFTDATGELAAEADIIIQAGALSGTGDVSVSDFSFQTLALGRVSGVNGAVHFDDLLALHTPPGQEVAIARIEPGVPLENGMVRFQLQGPGLARLESALWPFAGGVLAVEPTEWRLGAERRTVTVRADAIELAALTALLELPDFRAEGTVAGRFPIEFEAGNAFIRDARLAADGRGGRLSYTGATGQQAGAGNESVAMAFDALRNFDFTVLEIGADGNVAGQIVLTARLEGSNPDILDGQVFNFNVSIDSQLGQLLSSTRRLTGTDWLAEINAQETAE